MAAPPDRCHAVVRHRPVQTFAFALSRSGTEHLCAFASFVGTNKAMHAALKKRDCAAFAKACNGPGYKANDYDGKLQKAYHALTSRP